MIPAAAAAISLYYMVVSKIIQWSIGLIYIYIYIWLFSKNSHSYYSLIYRLHHRPFFYTVTQYHQVCSAGRNCWKMFLINWFKAASSFHLFILFIIPVFVTFTCPYLIFEATSTWSQLFIYTEGKTQKILL
jgi:hypothetical protein